MENDMEAILKVSQSDAVKAALTVVSNMKQAQKDIGAMRPANGNREMNGVLHQLYTYRMMKKANLL